MRIKKWMTMMDSMNDAELDETKMLVPSRILRIARGSGHHPHEVMELLEQFKLMQTTMQKTMKKNKKMGKGGMDLHNMDAATVAQMMHKMNPQMLAHLGGQQGLEQMMQEMETSTGNSFEPSLQRTQTRLRQLRSKDTVLPTWYSRAM